MSWIPDIPQAMVLIKRIEADNAPMRNASKLFWLFYNGSMGPEDFSARMAWWRDYDAEQRERGNEGFLDPDIEAIMLRGYKNPEAAAQTVVDRLDSLVDGKRALYQPDEPDDPSRLYVHAYLESTRLVRSLKTESYSDRSREILSSALNAFNRLKRLVGKEPYLDAPWSMGYGTCLEVLESFLHITQFHLQKSDGAYEAALKSLSQGIGPFQIPQFRASFSEDTDPEATPLLESVRFDIKLVPWMQDLALQKAVDCFEALRVGSHIADPKMLADIVEQLAQVSGESWLRDRPQVGADGDWSGLSTSLWPHDRRPDKVEDSEGNSWEPATDYWKYVLGWVEAQLQPSEFSELLKKRDDESAEQRLRSYFFGEELWSKLPERARSSLISADRDWFGGSRARTEVILNELKIATEELMHNGLWKPLEQWLEVQGSNRRAMQDFLKLKAELAEKRRLPTILDLERICRMSITDAYLAEKRIVTKERQWFIKELPRSLYHLRKARNRAEHESIGNWPRQELAGFVAEFIGIGRPGVLPQLVKILFQE